MKHSGVEWIGPIPSHWSTIRSKQLFAESRERARPGDEQLTASQDHGVILQRDFIASAGRRVVQVILNSEILKHVERDDFVISMRSFEGGLERARTSGCISSAYVVLRPSRDVDVRYFSHLFKSARYIEALKVTSNLIRDGQALRYRNFCLVDLPVLPVNEQARIAAFLDCKTAAVDALVEKKERLIELLQERRIALIHNAVTRGLDPSARMEDSEVASIGPIPAHWTLHQLRRVVSQFIDYRGRTPPKTDAGVPLITAGAIKDGRIDHALAPEWVAPETQCMLNERGRPEIGDLLFTTEAPLGEVGIVEDHNIACAQRVILFKVDRRRVIPEFLRLHFLGGAGRHEIQSRASGSTAEGIRADRLKMSLVPTPPISEQEAISRFVAERVAGVQSLCSMLRRQVDRLREYRQSLITAAVTGQIPIPEKAV